MKTTTFILMLAAGVWGAATNGAEPAVGKTPSERVGVYDSRVVAFAHFWSDQGRTERDALVAEARAAKVAGDTKQLNECERAIKEAQERSHLQVFSSAPADEALAALKDRLPAIEQELGVARLVSKWDEQALQGIPEANRVDATDRLAREFNPDEKRLKTIEPMKKSKPVPLDEVRRLIKAGKI